MTHTGTYLQSLSPLPQEQAKMPCVVLAHNELLILPEFLRHYREIGVDRFLIVDDHSTDGSLEFLRDQPDVTVFAPVEGSTFRKDKRFWRAELLDTYCSGKWVVVPDADEHLVYKGIDDGLDLFALARNLEDEGAEALHAVMLDMYCDMPLKDHQYRSGRLIDQFPLFDGPDHYFRIATPLRFREKYPTPFAFSLGGMRQRVFEPLKFGVFNSLIVRNLCDVSGNFSPEGIASFWLKISRFILRRMLKSSEIYNCSKLPLIKWQNGMYFYSGAHAISKRLRLSKKNVVLLHFKFASGVGGLKYNAERGQHADGSKFYKRIVSQEIALSRSPVFEGTQCYVNSSSLGRFLK
jgi:hypothetical protein